MPVLLRGGTEIQTLYLARALVAAGYGVSVCCYYQADPAVIAEFQAVGTRVDLLVPDRPVASVGGVELAKVGWLLWRYLWRIRPDIVHVQYLAPGLVPILAARAAGIPTVLATVHQPGEPYGPMARLSLRLAAALSTAFFCVSRSVEQSWFGDSALFDPSSVGKRRHFTLYDCVDVEQFAQGADQADTQAIREELGLAGHPVVGIVGRLRREKGHAVLLEALSLVVRSVPNVTLVVVGDGQEREHLEEQVRSLGLDGHIVWLGARRPEELPGLYGVMDVVAIPSQFEGFGLMAVEAMAAARPVVAFATGGLTEIVVDGVSGKLVPPGDRVAFAGALVGLITDCKAAVEMGKAGCRIVQSRFSQGAFSSLILSAYRRYAA